MIERKNYLKVNEHLVYLKEVMQLSQASVDRYRFYLRHLLLWAGEKDFSLVTIIRPTLPIYLSSLTKANQDHLAACTQKKILDASRRFFNWAKNVYPKEFGVISKSWIDTLRLKRQPQKSNENIYVTEEEVRKLISIRINPDDLALLRDQAAAAFLFLSGMRGTAFVTLPIGAFDMDKLTVRQWPELGVKTKNGNKATTFLFNIPDLLSPIKEWDAIIRSALPQTSSWYAPIKQSWGEQKLSSDPPGKNRLNALEKRMQKLFNLANLEYKSPHKFRHGNAVYGLLHAQTIADYKAVSMNLMHESIKTTDSIYAPMISSDVRHRITNLSNPLSTATNNEIEKFLEGLEKEGLADALRIIAAKLS
jgi:site-specific recombinase XerD